MNPEQEYENFDDFAQRSSHEERRQLFGRLYIQTASLQPNGARTPKRRSLKLNQMNGMM